MGTKSFQLEKTMCGVFLLQGVLGGLVAGLLYAAAICLWNQHFKFPEAVFMSVCLVILGSVAGVFKSIIMWVPYRLTKIQVGPATRVVITSIGSGVFALLLALKFGYGFERPSDTAAWVLTLVVGGLPTAILVGSSVKPWELFTFGSIDGERQRSVLGTLGTLPLRFVSLIVLALWILYFACWISNGKFWSYDEVLWFLFVTTYLFFSAYMTFRSPRKAILFVIGLGANVPVVYTGLFSSMIYFKFSYEGAFYVFTICCSLVISWAIFLIARLSARTAYVAMPLSILNKSSAPLVEQSQHECLGSRFMEWQERHA